MAFIEVDGILKNVALDIAQRAQFACFILDGNRTGIARRGWLGRVLNHVDW